MDSVPVGKYKGNEIYLIEKGNQYYISFGGENGHHYWLEALNRIIQKQPEYTFTAMAENDVELPVNMLELRPLIEEINRFIRIMLSK